MLAQRDRIAARMEIEDAEGRRAEAVYAEAMSTIKTQGLNGARAMWRRVKNDGRALLALLDAMCDSGFQEEAIAARGDAARRGVAGC